jgi:hypothetical protein
VSGRNSERAEGAQPRPTGVCTPSCSCRIVRA